MSYPITELRDPSDKRNMLRFELIVDFTKADVEWDEFQVIEIGFRTDGILP